MKTRARVAKPSFEYDENEAIRLEKWIKDQQISLGMAVFDTISSLTETIRSVTERADRLSITRLRMSKFIRDNGLDKDWDKRAKEYRIRDASHPHP